MGILAGIEFGALTGDLSSPEITASKPFVVAIKGSVGAGKSTLATNLSSVGVAVIQEYSECIDNNQKINYDINHMENPCEGCPRNCCKDFKIAKETTNPAGVKKELESFPYIHRDGSQLIMDPGGHETMVGVYNCDRFDILSGQCIDHDQRERPDFCQKTGNSGKIFPHEECLLKTAQNQCKN